MYKAPLKLVSDSTRVDRYILKAAFVCTEYNILHACKWINECFEKRKKNCILLANQACVFKTAVTRLIYAFWLPKSSFFLYQNDIEELNVYRS